MFILIFVFLYSSFLSISASMQPINDTYINQLPDINVSDISHINNALANLKNPFTKEEKFEKTKDLLTGEPFLDGGMFQARLFEDYEDGNRDPKILSYILYKTTRYGLTLLKSVLANPDLANYTLFKASKKNGLLFDIQRYTKYKLFKEQIQTKEFVLRGYETLYKELQWFSRNDIIHSFTPHDVFSYAFLFAFLRDIGYAKLIIYCSLHYDLITDMYQSFTKQEELQAQTLVVSLLNFYTEPDAGSINFDALQKWHGNKNHYILPIINWKDGLIGLNTLNLYSTKQFCLIGFGTDSSKAHDLSWEALTDPPFHDFLHGRQPLKKLGNGKKPSPERLYFYKIASIIIPDLITQYRQAKELNNAVAQQEISKHIFSLFFCLHEFSPNPESFKSMIDSNIIRYNIVNVFKSFIQFQNVYLDNADNIIDQKKLHKILFYTLDMLILFQKKYPTLSETLTKHDLKIEEEMLISTRANQIQYNQLLPALSHLVYCMSDAWTCFFEKYSIMFNGTMPFMKATQLELELLKRSY